MAKRKAPALPRITELRYEDGSKLEVDDDEMLESIMYDYFHRFHPRLLEAAFPDAPAKVRRAVYKVLTIARQSQESDRKSANAKRPKSRKPLPTKGELLAFRDEFEYHNGPAQGWRRAACGTAKRKYAYSETMNEFRKKYPRLDAKELKTILGE